MTDGDEETVLGAVNEPSVREFSCTESRARYRIKHDSRRGVNDIFSGSDNGFATNVSDRQIAAERS